MHNSNNHVDLYSVPILQNKKKAVLTRSGQLQHLHLGTYDIDQQRYRYCFASTNDIIMLFKATHIISEVEKAIIQNPEIRNTMNLNYIVEASIDIQDTTMGQFHQEAFKNITQYVPEQTIRNIIDTLEPTLGGLEIMAQHGMHDIDPIYDTQALERYLQKKGYSSDIIDQIHQDFKDKATSY